MKKEFKNLTLKFLVLLFSVEFTSMVVHAWTDDKFKPDKAKDSTSSSEERIDRRPKEGLFASIAQLRKDLSKVR